MEIDKIVRKGLFAIIILVALAISLFFFHALNANEEETETIRIGALLILSGDGAAWGQNAQRGMALALEKYEKNGRQIDIIYEDTQGHPSKAINSYNKLVDINKVDIIIGPLLQAEVAILVPLINEDNIPVITPSYVPKENIGYSKNPLTIWMDPSIEAARMAEYVHNRGVRKMAILGTYDSWEKEVSDSFAESFEKLGGEIVAKEIVQTDASDVRASVTKILNKKPDAIFLGTYYQFINSVRTIKEFNYEGEIYSIEIDSYLASETETFSEGLQFIAPDFYTSEFITEFEKKYGEKPGLPAGQAYDSMNILLSIIEKTDDRKEILKYISEFEEYDGVSGKIKITEDNRVVLPTAIFELRGGEAIKLREVI